MYKKLFSILTALMLLFQGVKAQNDSINAYLLTCEPGKAIYELYGHTAIWIEDATNNTDVVFNYGLFDFNTPHFVWRFTLGKTDYILGATSLRFFLQEYRERGSEVYSQQLNLTPDETWRLYLSLIENSRPENMVYRYNFLYNNCATMALDKIEQCVQGTVTYSQPDTSHTFRNLLTAHTAVRPWSEYAVDLIIGAEADLPLKYREEAFAPMYLKKLATNAIITDTAGIQRPLVLSQKGLIKPSHSIDFGKPLFTPLQTMWMVFFVVLLFTLLGWYKERVFWMVDLILFGIQGLGGIVIALMFFFSEHPTLDSNWLIICLNPLPLFFLPFIIRRIRHKQIPVFLLAEFTVCTAFLILSPAIPQKIHPANLILIATFALRALSTTLFMIHLKLGNAVQANLFNSHIPLTVLLLSCFATNVQASDQKRPKLVVGIVVDQLDKQSLEMMLPILGNDGLKMLWTDGYNRDNTIFDYDDTDRASAVASIYTGASPFQHGITASRWMNRKTLMAASPVDDGNWNGINTIEHTSPQKLLSTNLADEMKLESGGRSKICAIAAERDASVLAAGHEADLSIWINHENGKWCSSDYYGILPTWVNRLNDSITHYYEWRPLISTDKYLHIEYDYDRTFSYVIKMNDGSAMTTSPYGNDRVNAAALAAIDGMKLGGDDTPDLLALTYYAGNYRHENNSISSIELQDIYLRLDHNIAHLIKAINDKIGTGNVLYFITSTGYKDYKAPDLANTRIPTGTVSMERTTALLNLYLSAKYGSNKYVETYYRNQIYLDHHLIEDKKLSMHDILESSVDLLVQVSGISNVILLRDLMSTFPDSETIRKRNAFNNAYTGDIIINTQPGWGITDENDGYIDYPNPPAKPFPMILYGNCIHSEINHEPISVSVLIPTICNIIFCDVPNASYSYPITGLK